MIFKLKIIEGAHAGKEIAVSGSKFLIGRADECNLRPNSDAISRRHCVIIVTDKAVGVRDLKSRNGTLVNGEKITGDKRLRHGDTLTVGPLSFEVVLEKPAATAKAPKKREPAGAASDGDGGAMGGLVSQWLEEADDFAREEQRLAAPETREYRFDDTSRIALDAAAEKLNETAAGGPEGKEAKAKEAKDETDGNLRTDKAKKDTGKIPNPKFEVKKEKPKDTQEAASQVLRKLFNRS